MRTNTNRYDEQKMQKPAEWSEEDDKIRRNLMSLLVNMRGDRIDEKTYQKYYPWLKSLRPRPRWKPSEEQIGALERAIVKMHTANDIGILAELRDNLKKL